MNIAIYTLTSKLHDETAVGEITKKFLSSLDITYELKGSNYADYGKHTLNLIYVRTGGTEGIFKQLLPELLEKSAQKFYLLTSGKSNSLAASMEILSYLQLQGIKGEIIHGDTNYISKRIKLLAKVNEARHRLKGCRLGIIGQPSDWLISSQADYGKVEEELGIKLIDVPMEALLDIIGKTPTPHSKEQAPTERIREALPRAEQIYEAQKAIVSQYDLQGFTIRCFDLLTAIQNTGCLALARLNAEGIVAGCEGDVPAMLSMKIAQALTGCIGFQANPASINPETGDILFAHCTIPLNIVERYELDTHFESGIGIGIRGYMKEGPVTIFKISGNLSRHFIAEGMLLRSEAKPDLCRTQQVIQLNNKKDSDYFLTHPIGNHHIVLPGHQAGLLERFLNL